MEFEKGNLMVELIARFWLWLLYKRTRKEWQMCGHCYGDQRGECIRINRCINEQALKDMTMRAKEPTNG